MPVSATAKVSQPSRLRLTVRVIVPWSVNVAAFESMLKRAWRSLVWSVCIVPTLSGHATTSVVPFFSTSGWTIGALTGWGFSESEARAYEQGVERGDILLAVEVPDDAGRVEDIFKCRGGDRASTGTSRR